MRLLHLLASSCLTLSALGSEQPPSITKGLRTDTRILFIGNSHTHVNDVPGTVARLLRSDKVHTSPVTETVWMDLLNSDPSKAERAIKSSQWDAVVLQGAPASSSHNFHYLQDGPIRLAKLALSRKARVLLFVEWPRRGWNESDFQMGVYKEVQRGAPQAEMVPICHVWDKVRERQNGIDLWQPDGNHATSLGSFLAAEVLYRYLVGNKTDTPTWDGGLNSGFVKSCVSESLRTWSNEQAQTLH